MRRLAIVVVTLSAAVSACAADGAPIEGELLVAEAGLASPVPAGTQCHFRLRPAWRQGVNCQLLVTCPPTEQDEDGEDLFGGRRIGGYANCDTAEHAFLTALDVDPHDGDPAIELDLGDGTLRWRGRRAEETATLTLVGATRPTDWPEE